MPTKIHTLGEQESDWDILHNLAIDTFLDGECYAFARALHEGLGWPLVGLMEGDTIRHALVREPNGNLRDVRGVVTLEDCCRAFCLPFPAVTRNICITALKRKDEPSERVSVMTLRARRMAETLWPDLPWRNRSMSKAEAFADELESMCRRHGLWLHPMFPNSPIVISEECESELGYSLKPAINGSSFTIDRYFG